MDLQKIVRALTQPIDSKYSTYGCSLYQKYMDNFQILNIIQPDSDQVSLSTFEAALEQNSINCFDILDLIIGIQ